MNDVRDQSSSQSMRQEEIDDMNRELEIQGQGDIELTDSEGEDEFIRKYGDVQFQYIKRPRDAVWFIRPHALNYFKDGVLYRTKGERSSSKTELFLDLMYVGIIANLAGDATEHASWGALLKYILVFIGIWTVWCDIKDFTNYYYNEDLSQKTYILWILILLTIICNNTSQLLEGRKGAEYVIIPYILCRFSLCVSNFVYSFWVEEHRAQQRLYAATLFVTCCLWVIVIFVNTRAKIALSFIFYFLEQLSFMVCFHPRTKKLMKLTTSTALNIEHEVERFSVFVTIAIGEYLYKIVADSPLGSGIQDHFWRGVLILIIAYVLFWIYNYGSTSKKATHALRHSGFRAISWIYCHLPLVAAIVLSADAAGDLCKYDEITIQEREEGEIEEPEEPSIQAVKFFFTGGIFVALTSLTFLGLLDDPKDSKDLHIVSRFWRVIFRFPAGVIILCLPFADISITLLLGITTIVLVVLLVWESVTSTPRKCLPGYS